MSTPAEDIWAILREVAQSQKETDRKFQETDRKLKELGKQIGGLGEKFGSFTEGLALPSMEKILRERFGMEVVSPSVRVSKGGEHIEIDVLAYANGELNRAYVVEVKSRVGRATASSLPDDRRQSCFAIATTWSRHPIEPRPCRAQKNVPDLLDHFSRVGRATASSLPDDRRQSCFAIATTWSRHPIEPSRVGRATASSLPDDRRQSCFAIATTWSRHPIEPRPCRAQKNVPDLLDHFSQMTDDRLACHEIN